MLFTTLIIITIITIALLLISSFEITHLGRTCITASQHRRITTLPERCRRLDSLTEIPVPSSSSCSNPQIPRLLFLFLPFSQLVPSSPSSSHLTFFFLRSVQSSISRQSSSQLVSPFPSQSPTSHFSFVPSFPFLSFIVYHLSIVAIAPGSLSRFRDLKQPLPPFPPLFRYSHLLGEAHHNCSVPKSK